MLETVTSLSVAQDGQISDCRVLRNTQPGVAGLDMGDPCALAQPGGGPYFLASSEAAPRRARMRTAVFMK